MGETSILNKLKKIKELVDRGSDGEKAAASSLLDKLMKKNNIHPDELSFNEKSWCEFKCSNKHLRGLAFAIVRKITNQSSFTYRSLKKRKATMWFEFTRAQKIEFDYLFETYKKQLLKNIDILIEAFIAKNKIHQEIQTDGEKDEISDEDYKRFLEINKMVCAIDRVQVNKQIENKEI